LLFSRIQCSKSFPFFLDLGANKFLLCLYTLFIRGSDLRLLHPLGMYLMFGFFLQLLVPLVYSHMGRCLIPLFYLLFFVFVAISIPRSPCEYALQHFYFLFRPRSSLTGKVSITADRLELVLCPCSPPTPHLKP